MKPDELIMLLHDGELDPEQAEAVRALIEDDASAAALFEQLDQVAAVVRESVLAAPASSDLTDAVMARIEREPVVLDVKRAGAPRRGPGRALAIVSGALALAAGLSLLVTRAMHSESLARSGDVAAPVAPMSAPEPEPPEQSVAIERVDFGGSQGAVFMVPGSDDRTLVIWTLDDAPIWAVDDVSDDKGPEVDL
ncbi:MAG TPA: hypothetical protein VFQ35_12235 [Polyangiaceae bacterium]|nr:hypothetical protein [Polyangiaceae bacterium]